MAEESLRFLGRDGGFWHVTLGLVLLSLFLASIILQVTSPTRIVIDRVPANGVALIDELSSSYSDPAFVEQLRQTVEGAGFWFKYYAPADVTVPLFWALPALGYEVVVIRAHSTGWFSGDKITIFTGETYQKGKYYLEQVRGFVSSASTFENSQLYFTITPQFVQKMSQGKFPGTIVVMMGCNGLKNNQMASAFKDKGASAYVGWDEQVYARRSDLAALALVQALFEKHVALADALPYAMGQTGADSLYRSELRLYPDSGKTVSVQL